MYAIESDVADGPKTKAPGKVVSPEASNKYNSFPTVPEVLYLRTTTDSFKLSSPTPISSVPALAVSSICLIHAASLLVFPL